MHKNDNKRSIFFMMAMAMFALNQLTCTFDIFYVLFYSCFQNKVECFLYKKKLH